MNRSKLLIFSGALLLTLAFGFSACGPQAPVTPAEPPEEEASAPTETLAEEPTEEPAMSDGPVLEIVGPAANLSLTMDELLELPATEGYAGIKSSTGKITPPITFKGVALADLVKLVGGMDETTGFNVVAEDGYSITFSYDQINNGTFIAYDPATGDELKNPVELIPILAYEMDSQPLDPKQEGTLRLAIVSDTLNQVTDGHWSVKWVNKLEAKQLGVEWVLKAHGALTEDIDRASIESCGAPQCHGASWTDDKAQEWVGVPLWLLVGAVDDEITHEGPAFNDDLVDSNYSIDVIASDGYTVTFEAARVARNNDILMAYKVNDNPLVDKYFPLRMVGADLDKSEMAGGVVELKVDLDPLPAAEEPAPTEEPAAATSGEPQMDAEGSLVVVGLVDQAIGLMEANLRSMDVLQITAEHPKSGMADYEGVSLNTLLDMAGVQDVATALVITAADGYSAEVSLDEVRACSDCLLGFTNTLEKFKMVMPDLESSAWVKDVVSLEVK
ncbi:MAG: molybdopterin-dependent oxidoreductase [Anaerolineales bacterium]|jgi:DMSO/TMAO reductase YedYZ molybdopterin-dependent catalytic subunit